MSKWTDRIPPHDLDAEQALLGSCLHDREVIADVLALVPPGDKGFWYGPCHWDVYRAIAAVYEANGPVDAVVLRERLQRMGLLEKVGGVDYLVELIQSVPSAANAEHYARIVRDKAMLRRLIAVAGDIIDRAYAQAEDTQDILDTAERDLLEATEQRAQSSWVDVASAMHETVRGIRAGHRAGVGLLCGLRDLDGFTNGLRQGELIVLAARPGAGKSALATHIAEHVGFNIGSRVLFFSLEMTSKELVYRMLCSRARVNGFALRQQEADWRSLEALQSAAESSADGMVLIDETPQLTPLEIRAKARRHGDVGLVIVDYLQLMRCPGTENRQQEVAAISRSLAAMAKELRVPVLALAQLNRQSEGREGHRPRLSDLRESGQIEQDADVVLLLHRPSMTDANAPSNMAEVIVAKNRNGPTGVATVAYLSQWTKFGNWGGPASPFTDEEQGL